MAPTHRLKLQRVQWRALRVCLGLMTSTHTQSCEVLSGIMPLDIRWQYLAKKLICKSIAGPTRLRNSLTLLQSSHPDHPISVLAESVLRQPILQATVFPCYSSRTLKENLFVPKVALQLHKDHFPTSAAEIKVRFNALKEQYSNAIFVYTDGSRGWNGCSSMHFKWEFGALSFARTRERFSCRNARYYVSMFAD